MRARLGYQSLARSIHALGEVYFGKLEASEALQPGQQAAASYILKYLLSDPVLPLEESERLRYPELPLEVADLSLA